MKDFELLTQVLQNSGNKKFELKKMVQENKRTDIFYSVFSTKISAHLTDYSESNNNKIEMLSNFIYDIFYDNEKLLKIFSLFLDTSKYGHSKINSYILQILQFCLKFCLNSDEISGDYDNIFYPLYNDLDNFDSYIPGNDIRDRKIYDDFLSIKEKFVKNPSNYGVCACTCKIDVEDAELHIKFIEGNGFPHEKGICEFCKGVTGNDEKTESFYDRNLYYRVFKNDKDLEKELKGKRNKNCITLAKLYENYISKKIKIDSKIFNGSKKEHFNRKNKPIRNKSRLGYSSMNFIAYSHLFSNFLFSNKKEIFTYDNYKYLDSIDRNSKKIKDILDEKNKINIYIFMNLIYEDLCNYLNKRKKIGSYKELIKVEEDIEYIIKTKITYKTIVRDLQKTKYDIYSPFSNENKDKYRDNNPYTTISMVKENNDHNLYVEKDYPYYKNFLYSDYPNESFLNNKLLEIKEGSYPVIDLYLNRKNYQILPYKEFLCFNQVIKSFVNLYSEKISRNEAKMLT